MIQEKVFKCGYWSFRPIFSPRELKVQKKDVLIFLTDSEYSKLPYWLLPFCRTGREDSQRGERNERNEEQVAGYRGRASNSLQRDW